MLKLAMLLVGVLALSPGHANWSYSYNEITDDSMAIWKSVSFDETNAMFMQDEIEPFIVIGISVKDSSNIVDHDFRMLAITFVRTFEADEEPAFASDVEGFEDKSLVYVMWKQSNGTRARDSYWGQYEIGEPVEGFLFEDVTIVLDVSDMYKSVVPDDIDIPSGAIWKKWFVSSELFFQINGESVKLDTNQMADLRLWWENLEDGWDGTD